MAINTPIFSIAKDLNVESNRIILACKKLGINAKGATKRLNEEELKKIKSYFETGKNVCHKTSIFLAHYFSAKKCIYGNLKIQITN